MTFLPLDPFHENKYHAVASRLARHAISEVTFLPLMDLLCQKISTNYGCCWVGGESYSRKVGLSICCLLPPSPLLFMLWTSLLLLPWKCGSSRQVGQDPARFVSLPFSFLSLPIVTAEDKISISEGTEHEGLLSSGSTWLHLLAKGFKGWLLKESRVKRLWWKQSGGLRQEFSFYSCAVRSVF